MEGHVDDAHGPSGHSSGDLPYIRGAPLNLPRPRSMMTGMSRVSSVGQRAKEYVAFVCWFAALAPVLILHTFYLVEQDDKGAIYGEKPVLLTCTKVFELRKLSAGTLGIVHVLALIFGNISSGILGWWEEGLIDGYGNHLIPFAALGAMLPSFDPYQWAVVDFYINYFGVNGTNGTAFDGAAFNGTALNGTALNGTLWATNGTTGGDSAGLEGIPPFSILTALFPTSILAGLINGMPGILYDLSGIEMVPLMAEDCKDFLKDGPRALWMCAFMSVAFYTVLVILLPFVPPGAYTMSEAIISPHLDPLLTIYGIEEGSGWFIAMTFFANTMNISSTVAYTYGFTRLAYALARGGYMPTFMALSVVPGKQERIPWAACSFGVVVVLAVAALTFFEGGEVAMVLTVSGSIYLVIMYGFTGISYLYLWWRFPDLKRPWKSSFGPAAAVERYIQDHIDPQQKKIFDEDELIAAPEIVATARVAQMEPLLEEEEVTKNCDQTAELLKATICSLDLLDAMRGMTVNLRSTANEADHIHTLKIHIGIGVGSMLQVLVGSDGVEQGQKPRREFFIAGKAVIEAGEMLNRASSGEVALPARAFALLEDHFGNFGSIAVRSDGISLLSERVDLVELSQQLQGSLVNWIRTNGLHAAACEGDLVDIDDRNLEICDGLLPFLEESLAAHISKAATNRYYSTNRVKTSVLERQTTSSSIKRGSLASNRPRNIDSDVGQLRNVSIVFIRFSGLSVESMDDPQTLSTAQAVFGIIMETLRKLNGCLRQFACDDKASSALIVFGLAGFAHEKGEEKIACLAAWDICAKLKMLMGSGFSIGVTSGTVYVFLFFHRLDRAGVHSLVIAYSFYGIVGNDNRSDSTCMGVAVNLAARIMTHTHSAGCVVCDEPTYAKSAQDFDFNSLPEVHFKGSDAPVKIFQLAKKRMVRGNAEETGAGMAKPTKLYGRDAEMSTMLEQVERWVAGETVRILVLGRSGTGKSALTAWLKTSLTATHGKELIIGTAYGIDVMQNFYYHGLEQILTSMASQLLDLFGDDGNAACSQNEGMNRGAEASSPLILNQRKLKKRSRSNSRVSFSSSLAITASSKLSTTELRGLAKIFRKLGVSKERVRMLCKAMPALVHSDDDGDLVHIKSDPGSELAKIIAATLANAFNKLTMALKIKLVIVLEDVQWIDSTSFEIVLEFMSKCPEEIKPAMKPAFKKLETASAVLELSILDQKSTLQLIRSQFANSPVPVPDHIFDKILECGQGNPLVSHTICQAVRADINSLASSKRTGSTFENLNIPVDSTSAVVAQLDRLNPEFQVVLRVAAAHGQYFEIPTITSVLQQLGVFEGREEVITASYVRQLVEEQDIFHFIIVSDAVCSFSHFLIQQGILKSLTPSWLEAVHVEFVNLYETLLSDNDNGMVISSLLHHLMKVPGEAERKQRYLKAAFIIAAEQFRPAEGFEYYHMLEDLQLPRRLDLSEELLESKHLVNLYMQAGDPFTIFEVLQKSFKRLGFVFPLVKDGKGKTFSLLLKLFSRFLKVSSSKESTRRPLLYRTINELFPEFLKEFNMQPNKRGQIVDDSKLKAMLTAAGDLLTIESTNTYVALQTRKGLETVLLFLIRAVLCPVIAPNFDIAKACITAQLNIVFYFDLPLFSKMLSRRQTTIYMEPEKAAELDPFSVHMYHGVCLGLGVVANCACKWDEALRWVGMTTRIDPLLHWDVAEFGRGCRQSLFFNSRVALHRRDT
ncbi:hypothetical protein HK101_004451 [Irineochytrium annulatum]|nr:hypothetical protein HK101_004451 [Irineochytrium annulatum]